MISVIKKWQEKRRRKRILKIIKAAKQRFLDGKEDYMCLCFRTICSGFFSTTRIQKMIPEFNRETLGATTPEYLLVWWYKNDRESRIKAFDKLIEIYS